MKFRLAFIVFLFSSVSSFGQTKDNPECRALYNTEKFQEAYECYSKDEKEIFSVYMSAYLAKFLDDKKGAKKWSKKLFSKDFNSSETFYYGANLYPNNSKKFLKTLNKGLKSFPKDTLLMIEKVNYYITTKEYETGIPIIEELIELQKDDLLLYVTAGNIYSWAHKDQKAAPYYSKALELDKQNFDANYGLGTIYFNKAVDLIQESTETTSTEESDRLHLEAISLLKRALPFLEIAFRIDPENMNTKSALLTCYMQLKMKEEYKALKDS